MRSRFEYLRPGSVAEAVALGREHGDGAVFWAGGTDLVLQWKAGVRNPTHCVDLTGLTELRYIRNEADRLRIGAMTTLSEVARADQSGPRSDPRLEALACTARMMCTVQTRTIATVGGNLCNASPAADLIPPLVSMGAEIKVEGPGGERTFPILDLMTGPGKTSLDPNELLVEIAIPRDGRPSASAYRRIDRTVVDIALVSASSSMTIDADRTIASIRIALGAVAPRVITSPPAEDMLMGKSLSDLDDALLRSVGEVASASGTPISDVRASAAYRTAMVKVLVARTLDDNRTSLMRQTRQTGQTS